MVTLNVELPPNVVLADTPRVTMYRHRHGGLSVCVCHPRTAVTDRVATAV